ncbi:MAG: transposase [Coleofasciculus sp. B1-GNL1-01]|uniref:transposase n=1 Tax=Coleofasciculus sp. B1-GNL1-01 TaxID=3068484 RepID=UPI0032F9F318
MNQTAKKTLGIARQIEAQDVEVDAEGSPVLRRGVAKDRRISIEGCFSKNAFVLDWQEQTLTCPNQISVPLKLGKTLHFPASDCGVCPLRERCTTNQRGRSVQIHPDEPLLFELRRRQLTSLGRAKNRERTAVEHSLAHLGPWLGNRGR